MSLTTATARTLGTAELLEHILLQLPENDILLAQRICKAWAITISSSPALQTALYFRIPTSYLADGYTLNPHITSAFPFLLTPSRALSSSEEDNWRAKSWFCDDSSAPFPTRESSVRAFVTSLWTLNPEAWRRPEASWRRMYVCNPPITRVYIVQTSSSMGGPSIGAATVDFGADKGQGWIQCGGVPVDLEKEGGLKMGMLYDFLYDEVCTGDEPYRETSFCRNDGLAGDGSDSDVARGLHHAADGMRSNVHEREDGHGEGQRAFSGVTLSITLHRTYGCVIQDRPVYPEYRSDAYQRVELGPWKSESHLWDEYDDGDL